MQTMTRGTILGECKLVAFAPTTNPIKARAFYADVIGLRLVADEAPFALVFDANGTMLRVTTVPQHTPAPFTVLGWQVENIQDTVKELGLAGVLFLRFPGINSDSPNGIWTAPSGARIAWFNDPDGNILSITEFARSS